MPKIGEIKQAKDIWGSKNNHNFMWCVCPKCGKERWVLIVQGKPKSKHCNACAIRRPRRGQIIRCATCGKEIYVRPSGFKIKKYCSRECANKGLIKGKPLICKVCGKEYYRSPSLGSIYCSNKCKGEAITLLQSGENNPSWKGGVSTENHRLRASKRWRVWREAVFTRDNWTCQNCGARSGKGRRVELYPHHIKSFAKYSELRFEVSNGLTLCSDCHKIHTSWQRLNSKSKHNVK